MLRSAELNNCTFGDEHVMGVLNERATNPSEKLIEFYRFDKIRSAVLNERIRQRVILKDYCKYS